MHSRPPDSRQSLHAAAAAAADKMASYVEGHDVHNIHINTMQFLSYVREHT
jgi:hypothetical protein